VHERIDSLVVVLDADVNLLHAVATLVWQVDDDSVAVVTRLLLWQPAICVAALTPPEPGSPSGGNCV